MNEKIENVIVARSGVKSVLAVARIMSDTLGKIK